jgi:sodium pump decarboxylase gamma subunit
MLFSETMSIGERFINSLAITVLGMVVVFVVLIIIAYSINMLKILFGDKEEKKKLDDGKELMKAKVNFNTAKNNSKAEVDSDLIAVLSAVIAAQNTDEIIAVLTAAVLAQSGRSTEEIIIKSIVPIKQKSSIWASAGRQEQMLKTI